MSTHGYIGTLTGDGVLDARYVHCATEPDDLGPNLAHLIARDGTHTVLDTILAHPGWSLIEPDIDPDSSLGDDDTRTLIDGYGAAHTMDPDDPETPLTGRFPDDVDTSDLTWGFVFTPDTLLLAHTPYGGQRPVIVARIPLDTVAGMTDPADWHPHMCGAGYEHCHHYAHVHTTVPEQSDLLTMRQWLGLDPLTTFNALSMTTPEGTVVFAPRQPELPLRAVYTKGRLVFGGHAPYGWMERGLFREGTLNGEPVIALTRMIDPDATTDMWGVAVDAEFTYPPTAATAAV